MGNHRTHILPHVEDVSHSLQHSSIFQQQPPSSSQEPCLEQPLFEEVVEMEQSFTNPAFPSESDENIAHVSFVSSIFPGQRVIPSMVPPTIPEVISFDWNSLVEPHLPSYLPFHILVEVLY